MAKNKTTTAQTSSKSIPVAQLAQVAQPTLADRIAAQEQELKNMQEAETVVVAERNGAKVGNKTTCPVTRKTFTEKAKPVVVDVAGTKFIAQPKEFSTGSLGYYVGEKMIVTVDGVPCRVQVSINLTVVGSKELPHGQ